MRIVFMGTPEFSVPALKALVQAGHQVAGVVTQPDKPKGRGKAIQVTPVKAAAQELGIPVYQPAKVRDPEFIKILQQINPDVIVVEAFGQLIPPAILDLPPYGCINIHASLLPRYRGAAPIQWAVIDGEKESGVTTMKMDPGLDTGDMLEKAVVPLDPEETGGSLHDKLMEAGAKLILSTLEKAEKGTLVPVPQTDEGTCYARRLTKELGDICWQDPAVKIERLIRGLNPWPSAFTCWKGKILKIWRAQVISDEQGQYSQILPGQVAQADGHRLLVQTGDGLLSLQELQLEGKKRMDVESFLRGCPIAAGDVFERRATAQ